LHIQIVRDLTTGKGFYKLPGGASMNKRLHPALMQHACQVAILLLSLGDVDRKWFEETIAGATAFKWIVPMMMSIEVVWLEKLHKVYFLEPPSFRFVVRTTMDSFVKNVDRLNAETKLKGFLEKSDYIYTEMQHQQRIHDLGLSSIFSGYNLTSAKDFSFYLALIINSVLFLTYARNPNNHAHDPGGIMLTLNHLRGINNDDRLPGEKNSADSVLLFFLLFCGILQACASGFILVMFLAVKVPPSYQQYDNVVRVFFKTPVCYFFIYTLLAVLGNVGYYWMFSLHLLDIIVRDQTTRNVLDAVVKPFNQLRMASILGVFIMFIFTLIFFLNWADDAANGECDFLWSCLLFIFKGGLIGDLHDNLAEKDPTEMGWVTRVFFWDMLYFIAINIILLNIIFGIIIDTFAALRDEQMELREDTENVCFICSHHRDDFERIGVDFREHTEKHHNMWNYLKYLIYIKRKPTDEYNGLEYFVNKCLNESSISWFPIKQSLEKNKAEHQDDRDDSNVGDNGLQAQGTETLTPEQFAMAELISQRLDEHSEEHREQTMRVIDYIASNGQGRRQEENGA
jgi:hypothetical protein